MSEFRIPPISTLIGSDLVNFIRVTWRGKKIAPGYFLIVFLTFVIILISTPFHFWEFLVYNRKVKRYRFEKPPLFILGHWRSGTTFLHNLLCAAPGAGFVTTYHSVFPNNLASSFIFKNFMKANMPEKRPSDNVKLGVDLPQEDEFALSNLTTASFYHYFYFPERYIEYYRESVSDVNENKIRNWDRTYWQLIAKAMIYSKGSRAILKNPVNTARIPALLRIFPDAKFIFIYRNPVTVFLSCRKFFQALLPTLWFHPVSAETIDNMILDNFRLFMDAYESQKHLIPEENLVEIRFEDFEKDPMLSCHNLYTKLFKEDITPAIAHLKAFLKSQKGYSRNTYRISPEMMNRFNLEWSEYMKKWNYEMPAEVVSGLP